MENKHRVVPCFVRITNSTAFYVCFGVSFMTLTTVSYERLVAVRLPIRYNSYFSSKRSVRYISLIWLHHSVLAALKWAKINRVIREIHLIVWLICLLISAATQIGILATVRQHRKKVHLHLQGGANVPRQLRESKLAKGISVIVGVSIVLNFPVLFVTLYHETLRLDWQTYNHYNWTLWTETLAFLNSSSYPFICCWKNPQIRRKVKA